MANNYIQSVVSHNQTYTVLRYADLEAKPLESVEKTFLTPTDETFGKWPPTPGSYLKILPPEKPPFKAPSPVTTQVEQIPTVTTPEPQPTNSTTAKK